MPGPIVPKRTAVWSQLFGWTEPENASVFDSTAEKVARRIINFLGLSDPNQIMMLATPMEVPNSDELGGVVGMLARKYPRFAKAIQAYHGSPHDFEQFSGEKIGTGEGAQAYGHGLYFAESPGVAGSYKDSLVKPLIGGRPAEEVYQSEPKTIYDTLRLLRQTNPAANFEDASRVWATQSARANVVSHVASYGSEAGRFLKEPESRALYDSMLKSGEISIPKGKMYEVAIHADPSHFLDWDTPLSQQSAYVQAAVQKAARQVPYEIVEAATSTPQRPNFLIKMNGQVVGASNTREMAAKNIEEMIAHHSDPSERGAAIYKLLSGFYAPGSPTAQLPMQADAASALKDAGIAGIKYLDAGSRAAGEGSRNYVVFPGNEHLIDILKKYGILATVGGGGLAASQSSQTPQ